MEVEPSLGAWFPSEVFACERRSGTCPPQSAHEMLRTHRASAGRGLLCHTPTASTHLGHSFLSFRGQFELCFLHAQPSPSSPGSGALPSVCAGALFPPWAPRTPCACLPPLPPVIPVSSLDLRDQAVLLLFVVVLSLHVATQRLYCP